MRCHQKSNKERFFVVVKWRFMLKRINLKRKRHKCYIRELKEKAFFVYFIVVWMMVTVFELDFKHHLFYFTNFSDTEN